MHKCARTSRNRVYDMYLKEYWMKCINIYIFKRSRWMVGVQQSLFSLFILKKSWLINFVVKFSNWILSQYSCLAVLSLHQYCCPGCWDHSPLPIFTNKIMVGISQQDSYQQFHIKTSWGCAVPTRATLTDFGMGGMTPIRWWEGKGSIVGIGGWFVTKSMVHPRLDLNILTIDWSIKVWNFFLKFFQKFWENFLAEENCYNLANF